MWVAAYPSKKLRASDGAELLTVPTYGSATGITYDGANVWILTLAYLYKVRPSDGTILATLNVGDALDVAFDGTYIWTANIFNHTVTRVDAKTATIVDTISTGQRPQGLAFDGQYMWVANTYSNNVVKVDPSSGAIVATYPSGGAQPRDIEFDGVNMWVLNTAGVPTSVAKLNIYSGAIEANYTFPYGTYPTHIACDGAYIWMTIRGADRVWKIRASDGHIMGKYPTGDRPGGLAFDGANMWVANEMAGTVSKR
jgi:YVTN family beta-propeller protein